MNHGFLRVFSGPFESGFSEATLKVLRFAETLRKMRFLVVSVCALAVSCYRHSSYDSPSSPPAKESIAMVSIPAGTFTMGDVNGEPEEYPERELSMHGFRMQTTEVTNADYVRCVSAAACDKTPYLEDADLGKDDHPVVGVSFKDATRYCKWLGMRLPSEAEWEYAAKGRDHRKWPWRGAFDPAKANTAEPGDGYEKTAPVDALTEGSSPFGLLNMAGNAAEWVRDYFDPTYYRTSKTLESPLGPGTGRERVIRGGSYRDTSHTVRVAARRPKLETEADSTVGFRCSADN